MLPKINKSDVAGRMESIEEYLRSRCGKYPMYAFPDIEIITRMLHLPPDKNKLLLENDVQRVKDHMAEYESTTGQSMMSWIRHP